MAEPTPTERFLEWKAKGNDSFKKSNYKEAIEYYTRAIGVKEDEAVGYLNRAACHLSLKNYFDVIDDCNKALELDPENSKSFYRRGLAYIELSRLRLAKRDLERADHMVQQAHTCRPHLKKIDELIQANQRLELKPVEKPLKYRSTKPMQIFKLNNQYCGSKAYNLEKE